MFPDDPYVGVPFAAMTVIKIVENCEKIRSLTSSPIEAISLRYDSAWQQFYSEFILDPKECPLEFCCTTGSKPEGAGDFCDFIMPSPDNLIVDVTPINPDIFPPGDYVITIEAKSGDKNTTETFTTTIEDPCATDSLAFAR